MDNATVLLQIAKLLKNNKNNIAKANTNDVQTSFQTNKDNVQRAISALKAYAEKYPKNNNSHDGIALFSCYGDPSFGLFGMTLAPAIMGVGHKATFLIGFPEILKTYAELIEKLITDSGLLPNAKFIIGTKKFMQQCLADQNIKHTLIFGDVWVHKFVEQFKYKKSLTLYGAGNNAAVILPNANFEQAVDKILESAFILSGQAAVCINRCIIDSRVDKLMIKKLFEQKLKNITYGFDADKNYVTPIIIPPLVNQISKRLQYVEKQSITNYSVTQNNNCHLISPTLVWLEQTNQPIWTDYHFAPVLPIAFKDFEQISAEVNLTEYGIYASLWGEQNELNLLSAEIKKEHIFVLQNQSVLDMLPLNKCYTEGWGGYKRSGFCISKKTNWELKHGAFNFYDTVSPKH